MSTMTIRRGFAQVKEWTIEDSSGVPKDLDPFDAVRIDFDDSKKAAADKLTLTATVLQTGSGPTAVNKGRVRLSFLAADTAAWVGDVVIRAQWRLRAKPGVASPLVAGEWYGGDPERCVVIDRVTNTL